VCLFADDFFFVLFGHEVHTGFGTLCIGNWRRCIGEWVMSVTGLRERNYFANRVGSGQQRQNTVPTEGNATVGWGAVFEGFQQETKFLLSLFVGDAHNVEDALLNVLVMDT